MLQVDKYPLNLQRRAKEINSSMSQQLILLKHNDEGYKKIQQEIAWLVQPITEPLELDYSK